MRFTSITANARERRYLSSRQLIMPARKSLSSRSRASDLRDDPFEHPKNDGPWGLAWHPEKGGSVSFNRAERALGRPLDCGVSLCKVACA
ncbi:hypothetical protein AQZ52_03255 [Novosphingobium fuchskuhlense]|uniref:Uncharacterized protein n=1 Tax=Novosphingobium fuchskuhlense TaxID=1117702 RepID=A0A124JVI5_9SPHN|nr:hypothetical protein AQZ52_03255 [Novosphingobium fuchskuhlense]